MNKMILTLAAVALLASSCEKAQPLQPSVTPGITSGANNDGTEDTWGLNWWWKEGPDICWPYALDCFDEVVVTPSMSEYVTEFETAIGGGAGDIGNFFTYGNWAEIFPHLSDDANDEILTDLQSGDYYIDITDDAHGQYYYHAKLTGTGALLCVLQLDKSQL
jgi:hypothetical protein